MNRACCLFFLFWALGRATAGAAQPARPSFTLVGKGSGPDALSFYYQNEFNDVVRLLVVRDSATHRWQPLTVAAPRPVLLHCSRGMEAFVVYARPGDTIMVQAHEQGPAGYTFDGRRPAELNFFNGLAQRGVGLGLPDAMGLFKRPAAYKDALRFGQLRDQRLALLNRAVDSLGLSPAFIGFVRHFIQAQYWQARFSPYWGDPTHSYDQFPAAYVADLTAAQVPDFLAVAWTDATMTTQVLATSYVRFLGREALDSPQEFGVLLAQAERGLSGPNRDYAGFILLKPEVLKGSAEAATALPQFRGWCRTQAYVRYLDSLVARSQALALSPALQATRLESAAGETVSWQQLLAHYRGRAVYVDLWASWCGPCLAEMPAAQHLRQSLNGQAVSFVYLSLDTDSSKWKRAVATQHLNGPTVQHFRLDPTSPLAKFFNAPPIPRYLLFDKQGQVVTLDAARPSNPQLLGDLSKQATKQ